MSSVQTWAKALTAMEDGWEPLRYYVSPAMGHCWWAVHPKAACRTKMRETYEIGMGLPSAQVALAAACDALGLPWREHPVWLMHLANVAALPVLEWALENVKAHMLEFTAERRDRVRKALDAAKGG